MYTYTYTRTSVLVDQVDLFLSAAGIADSTRKPVVDAISERWLEQVGVFIEDDGQRVLEGALQIRLECALRPRRPHRIHRSTRLERRRRTRAHSARKEIARGRGE